MKIGPLGELPGQVIKTGTTFNRQYKLWNGTSYVPVNSTIYANYLKSDQYKNHTEIRAELGPRYTYAASTIPLSADQVTRSLSSVYTPKAAEPVISQATTVSNSMNSYNAANNQASNTGKTNNFGGGSSLLGSVLNQAVDPPPAPTPPYLGGTVGFQPQPPTAPPPTASGVNPPGIDPAVVAAEQAKRQEEAARVKAQQDAEAKRLKDEADAKALQAKLASERQAADAANKARAISSQNTEDFTRNLTPGGSRVGRMNRWRQSY